MHFHLWLPCLVLNTADLPEPNNSYKDLNHALWRGTKQPPKSSSLAEGKFLFSSVAATGVSRIKNKASIQDAFEAHQVWNQSVWTWCQYNVDISRPERAWIGYKGGKWETDFNWSDQRYCCCGGIKGLENQNDSCAIVFTSPVSLLSCLHIPSLLDHILFGGVMLKQVHFSP